MKSFRWVTQVLMPVVYADPGNMKVRNFMADASEQLGYQAEARLTFSVCRSGSRRL
ncbi:MAG: alkyl sulfatase dimerization domain-containing protein [Pseudolabrys sp.]